MITRPKSRIIEGFFSVKLCGTTTVGADMSKLRSTVFFCSKAYLSCACARLVMLSSRLEAATPMSWSALESALLAKNSTAKALDTCNNNNHRYNTNLVNERSAELEQDRLSLQLDTQVNRWVCVQRLDIDVNLQDLGVFVSVGGLNLDDFFLLLVRVTDKRGVSYVRCQNVKLGAFQRVVISDVESLDFQTQLRFCINDLLVAYLIRQTYRVRIFAESEIDVETFHACTSDDRLCAFELTQLERSFLHEHEDFCFLVLSNS